MEDEGKTPEKKPTKGYGKRPAWQWVFIYIVIAIVVYGLIYYIFIKGGDNNGGGSLGY
jgi:hypothetical protein